MVAERGLQGFLNINILQATVQELRASHASQISIDDVSEKPVIWNHCMAHEIELVLSDALFDASYEQRKRS